MWLLGQIVVALIVGTLALFVLGRLLFVMWLFWIAYVAKEPAQPEVTAQPLKPKAQEPETGGDDVLLNPLMREVLEKLRAEHNAYKPAAHQRENPKATEQADAEGAASVGVKSRT